MTTTHLLSPPHIIIPRAYLQGLVVFRVLMGHYAEEAIIAREVRQEHGLLAGPIEDSLLVHRLRVSALAPVASGGRVHSHHMTTIFRIRNALRMNILVSQ